MSIEDDLDEEYAEAWKPSAGEKLTGTVVDVSSRLGSAFGGKPAEFYPIVTVRRSDGTRLAFHAYHTVAKKEVEERKPAIGDGFGAKYKGEVPTKDGSSSFHSYVIRVYPPAGQSVLSRTATPAPTSAPAAAKSETPWGDDEAPF